MAMQQEGFPTVLLDKLLTKVNPKDYEGGICPYPGVVLTTHVTTRTAQVGAAAGTLVGIVQAFRHSSSILSYSRNGMLLGIVLGPLMTAGRSMSLDKDGIIDRGYRLKHNVGQRNVDIGSAAGFLLSGLAFRSLGAGAIGLALGAGAYPAYNLIQQQMAASK